MNELSRTISLKSLQTVVREAETLHTPSGFNKCYLLLSLTVQMMYERAVVDLISRKENMEMYKRLFPVLIQKYHLLFRQVLMRILMTFGFLCSGQQDHRNDLSHPIHADNCLLDPEANECWKEPPAYTYRDYRYSMRLLF